MDLQALKLAFSYAPPRMCLKLCGISGDCRSRPVNMGDEPVNELSSAEKSDRHFFNPRIVTTGTPLCFIIQCDEWKESKMDVTGDTILRPNIT